MSRQNIFNGHTWIIMLVAILTLGVIGIGALGGLFYLLSTSSASVLTGLEAMGIPMIPYVVVKGIVILAETMTGKEVTETLETRK